MNKVFLFLSDSDLQGTIICGSLNKNIILPIKFKYLSSINKNSYKLLETNFMNVVVSNL